MKFTKRKMRKRPSIKQFDGNIYEAVDWYRSKRAALKKAKEYHDGGFLARTHFESWWPAWFVYISNKKLGGAAGGAMR